MITLWRKFWHALLWDELAARRWLRGAVLCVGGAGITVASVGWDVAQGWTLRDWAGRLVFAAVLGAGGMITAGEKNPKPEAPAS